MRAWNFEAVGLSVCSAASRSVGQCRLAAVLGGLVLGCVAGSAAGQTMMLLSDSDDHKIVRFGNSDAEVIDHFVANGISPLRSATGMTLTANGNLLVASFNNNSVQLYSGKTGKFLYTFVTNGSGGLEKPIGIIHGPDGNLFVVSWGNGQVLRYDSVSGDFLNTIVTGIATPHDVAFLPDGTMLVTSFDDDRIGIFDPSDGSYLGDIDTAGTGLDGPTLMTTDANHNVYVGSYISDSIIRIDGTTRAASVFVSSGDGDLDGPQGMAFDDNGNLLVVSLISGSVLKFDTHGNALGTLISPANNGGLTSIYGILLYTPCTADFNDDGTVNTLDVLSFLNAWTTGCP